MSAGNYLRTAISAGARHEERSGTVNSQRRLASVAATRSGPNGAGKMLYAQARLRASDEARSAALERDSRVYTEDADETNSRPCGGRWQP